jgi:hypothetical protein|tara:strand:- start:1745 stop:2815 length:1071 start_codon:yes stop_codon:yes gene_type:complete
MHCSSPLISLAWLFGSAISASAQPSFEKEFQPYLDQHCVRCHGEKKQKGDFRLDELSRKVGEHDTPLWAEVMERISSGEMPPEDEENLPAADESARIVGWISERLREGESARMARRDKVSYHRLTREEYVNAVRDLIGVEYDATDPGGLLEDPEWNGFERIGSVLTLSPTHIEKYIKAAEVVLDEAYPDEPIKYLEVSKRAAELREHDSHYERLKADGLLDKIRVPLTTSGEIFRGSNPYRGPEFNFPGAGIYEISYTVCGITPEGGQAPRLQVYEHKLDRILFEQDIIASEVLPLDSRARTLSVDSFGVTSSVTGIASSSIGPGALALIELTRVFQAFSCEKSDFDLRHVQPASV